MRPGDRTVSGEYVELEGETYYKIAHYDRMDPFFMSIVSDSDHWMFIWSSGALSAGRRNADTALFPYDTDDRILDSTGITGSATLVIVHAGGKRYLWEPFSKRCPDVYETVRNCYKNIRGNKLLFEEINHDLGLTFSYAWMNSERFGFIKRSRLLNHSTTAANVTVLDGIQNILACGINQRFQMEYSTLADAYKKNELLEDTGIGIYSLSSIPVDKAEPSEAMRATVVWSAGLQPDAVLLSSGQLDRFRRGLPVSGETDVRGVRGAYFIHARVEVPAAAERVWYIAADVAIDTAGVVDLAAYLRSAADRAGDIEADVRAGTENLVRTVAAADGLQKTADRLSTSRHFANVLFNVMRGGIFDGGYHIETADFIRFAEKASSRTAGTHRGYLQSLPAAMDYEALLAALRERNDPALEKLGYEYLPLTFSRRHGDPSRPWNRFSIDIKDAFGGRNLNYEGNWRDIFQNWEALALSFPGYIEAMITKFVNGSTPDGYNPYRIGRDGFEWEIIDPDDAWSYIGYWGDHQIIYLLKLLELSRHYHPGALRTLLARDMFTYANVPYRIASYEAICADPHHTVTFDADLEETIEQRTAALGSDGKCVLTGEQDLYLVTLTEKLLVPLLVKLSNFIPGAGIWMNTQRPEWNDANNALVGYGVSMVTLFYLRRHLSFCRELFSLLDEPVAVSVAAADFLDSIVRILGENRSLLTGSMSNGDRRACMDMLGTAGSVYREAVYSRGFPGGKRGIGPGSLQDLCREALEYVDHTIAASRREDGLYHAYNLITLTEGAVSIRRLSEMLEGQVAVLSSGYLTPEESVAVLDALRASSLYREDQAAYLLYPDKTLPRFVEKNTIPAGAVGRSRLIPALAAAGDERIVVRDGEGGFHFNGSFRNAAMLREALTGVAIDDPALDFEREKALLVTMYEEMFDHQSFTGRSGTFFKYEGLGSVYWHMVSKLLLAVKECFYRAVREGAPAPVQQDLRDRYYEIRTGIGVTKSPDAYGAFPTDPYSHTPAHLGAQQPGMTGQVKEDILSRFGELGVTVREGRIGFSSSLLRDEEYLPREETFTYIDVEGSEQSLLLEPGSLAFTVVQVPVVYHRADARSITITRSDGRRESMPGPELAASLSGSIFRRTEEIRRIDVWWPLPRKSS
ncbi:hypothetical protein JXO52_01950 [bacterium]|nr:hypothetical protein [bacterium]